MEAAEIRGHLKQALLELEPHYRTVIVLKHLEGFSYREIGELLEIPEKTVKSRLFTARQRLRVNLTERGFAPLILIASKPSCGPALTTRSTRGAGRLEAHLPNTQGRESSSAR